MSENINKKNEIPFSVKVKNFLKDVKVKLILFGKLIIKYSEEILNASFYVLSIYFICLGFYFTGVLIYKLYEICVRTKESNKEK